MYKDQTIEKYLTDASANQPVPGGGSASALAGAAGCAMACMAANFTVANKKYQKAWPRVNELLATLTDARERLLECVDEDVAAYGYVVEAAALPKETASEKRARSAAIQEAVKIAMTPPLKAFRNCDKAIETLNELADLVNPNLLSDVGVAAVVLEGALKGSMLNVEVNLAILKDARIKGETQVELYAKSTNALENARKTYKKVHDKITAKI